MGHTRRGRNHYVVVLHSSSPHQQQHQRCRDIHPSICTLRYLIMSALPYLQKLRKSDLTEFAETTKLRDYASLKKAELEVALNEHLRSNSTTYSKEPSLNEYYKRLGSTSRSPVKRIAEKVSDTVKSDEETMAPPKKSRRKTTSPTEETTDTDSPANALIRQPAKEIARRTSILTSQIPIPPSPAVVTDAIDQQTRRMRASISQAYDRTQIHEVADQARDYLSSPLTVTVLAILLEAYGLRAQVLPNKLLTEVPAIPYIKSTKTPINVPLKAHPSHTYSTRRAALQHNTQMQFDPFIFNLAKGLIAYLVYAQHFNIAGIYQHFTIATVNESILGGYFAILISSGLGAAVSLYDAVLRK